MKRVPALLLLFVLVQLAGPWGWNVAAGDGIIRQGVLIPYEIRGPEGWSYQAEPHQFVLGVFRPEGDDPYPFISLTMAGGSNNMNHTGGPLQQEVTPEALQEANLYARPGARLLSSRWLGEEDDQYLLAEFSWSSVFGEIRSIKAFHPWGDAVLTVTATCLAADFEEYQPVLLESIMSVRIKGFAESKGRKKQKEQSGEDAWLYSD